MKHFTYKISFFVLLILITCILIELMVRNIPNEYKLKKEYLDKNSNEIEVLFLGGSHSRSGLNPEYLEKQSFNAAHYSQSLDYDFEILKKYNKKWSNLKYIVLPISYGTLFSKLEGSEEPWRVKNYIIYYNITLSKRLKYRTEIMNGMLLPHLTRLYKFYFKSIYERQCSETGWGLPGDTEDLVTTGVEAAIRHTVPFERQQFEEMKSILDSITSFSEKNNCKLILIIPPATESYRNNLVKSQLDSTINTVIKVSEKNPNSYYLNLLDDPIFKEGDFRDGDHLNGDGARKLTLMIDSIINSEITGSCLSNNIFNKYQ